MTSEREPHGRTAADAGWHASRYNLYAEVPGSGRIAVANLFRGAFAECAAIELCLMDALDEIAEDHPVVDRLARRGIIVDFDELDALEAMGRIACGMPRMVGLSICPTFACNFDCPYCFEEHRGAKMARQVQDDVVALAGRMLDAAHTGNLRVRWVGGEPLLALDVIEALSTRLMALSGERGGAYRASVITNGYLLTPANVAALEAAKVDFAQVTLDGVGEAHDATRHLAGGGPTFAVIASNLRSPIPFAVKVRHNVHAGNHDQMEGLEAFVRRLAEETGNDLSYTPTPVFASEAADKRGRQVGLLCDDDAAEVAMRRDARSPVPGRGHFCDAHGVWNVGVDERGNLHKCWEEMGSGALPFADAGSWNPADPLATASAPDNLTKYLNTACPVPDDECRGCVWLPACVGGCPRMRLSGARGCLPYKGDERGFVLELRDRLRRPNV